MKIFFDTGVFIALFIKEDINYTRVFLKYREYRKDHHLFYTSDYILDELFTRLMYDCGEYLTKIKMKEINYMIEKKELLLLSVDKDIFNKAQEVFLKFSEHKFSFTDATCYVLYKEYKLDEIFTVDGGFNKIHAKTSFPA